MKIKIVLMAVFCMILGAAAVSAQEENKTTNFAGNWVLDAGKSKLPDRTRIESMTMNVAQTDKDLTVETKTKRAERAEGEMRGGGNGGGMRRGGAMMDGDAIFIYTLDGKETSAASSATIGETKLKAALEKNGKLKLVQTRNFETQRGAVSVKIVETWELLDGGKSLLVKRETETPRGTQSSEMYFTKH